MKQLILQAGCEGIKDQFISQNATSNNSLLAFLIRGCAHTNDTSFPMYVDIIDTDFEKKVPDNETDSGAVMYIVAVLVFYSAGIIVMIVKYLRREKRELEEERILDDFFRSMPEYKREREQNKMNKVAIHAFHALTSFSENIVDNECSSEEDDDKEKFKTKKENGDKAIITLAEIKEHTVALDDVQVTSPSGNISTDVEINMEKDTCL